MSRNVVDTKGCGWSIRKLFFWRQKTDDVIVDDEVRSESSDEEVIENTELMWERVESEIKESFYQLSLKTSISEYNECVNDFNAFAEKKFLELKIAREERIKSEQELRQSINNLIVQTNDLERGIEKTDKLIILLEKAVVQFELENGKVDI